MVGDRSPQPPRETWEALKPEIRKWYLKENQTCEYIQKQLRLRSLFVSERQIKNRLSEWKYERKKTPHQHYLAMLVVAESWKARGGEAVFEVPKREERVTYNAQKVKKECERVRKRHLSQRESFKLPSLCEAEYTLRSAGISWKDKDLIIHHDHAGKIQLYGPPLQWHANLHGLPHRTCPSRNRDILASGGGGLTLILNRQDDKDSPPSELEPVHICAVSPDEPKSRTPSPPKISPKPHTPPSAGSPERVLPPNGTVATTDCQVSSLEPIPCNELSWPEPVRNMADGNNTSFPLDPSHMLLSPPAETFPIEDKVYSPPYSSCSVSSTATLVVLATPPETIFNPNACRSCQPPHSHQSYDFSESIGTLCKGIKYEPPVYSAYVHPVCSFQDTSEEDRKLSASQWAAPYYLQCFSENLQEDILEYRKSQSMDILQYALQHNNEFILPCLSWTMLVLGQTQRMEQLADFLSASCDIISSQPAMRKSYTYEVPFRYALAWASNDLEEMDLHGESLGRSHTQIGQIWGREHPNFFVSGYLYAWHSIWKGDYHAALRLLINSLPVCERTMGRHDLLTINCLSIAARAYAHIGRTEAAVRCYRRAMSATQLLEEDQTHVEAHGPVLQLFRSTLLSRHAMLLYHLQDPLNAEKQLRKVLDIRVLIHGVHNLIIWWAAWPLASILQATGQFAHSEALMDELLRWHYWEQEVEWCIRRGEPPPPRPPFQWLRFGLHRTKKEEGALPFRVAEALYPSQICNAGLEMPQPNGMHLAQQPFVSGGMDVCLTVATTVSGIPQSERDWDFLEP
ncbi:hypothetical protein, variant [Cladophialophora immunda]|uniref:Clr5 domain-containing protein n=1 Tax=Cladophialophora immunda TaxID=569365 RepID=A0A0D2DAY7_9EURO|nr:uncharacterized protein PV07_04383 [Cladophialophora immunda]XP_016253086.1 hypothetical protein, variant [Cladophialophora immunda]KIW32869.1 hypothetical protein PV07_04383 [Cladophialophora immunda]KIW32870.1 hypothetical protein, variant [Cladophialophora immunda]OQU95471.1 hypothetical protein CLAIMM_01672 isoform 1 [Cladophialophora immunda]OQU95472.1 hypothetical protein CLAIMM_01672 isoform 2 [Cladophialophora immunda]